MIRAWATRHRATIFHWSMEVVIVVIGILIAFALQDWAGEVGSRRRAADADRRIRLEIVDNAHDMVERIAIASCLRARVAELSERIVSGDRRWRATAWRPAERRSGFRQSVMPIVYPVPSRGSNSDAYRGSLNDGDLASADSAARATLASIYKASDRLDAINREENELADQLQPLQYLGVQSAQDRRVALTTLARLDAINGLARLIADQYLGRVREAGYRMTAQEIARMRAADGWPARVAYGRGRYGACWDTRAIAAFEPGVLAGGMRVVGGGR